MGQEYAVEVENITKHFKVYYDKGSQLKEKMLFWKRNRYENRWVLNGISFQVKKGEAIGLIGKNGCGKSTTLKMLSRIMYPDSGTIKMNGKVSSLIELGAGFHPDMSGRENIYTNAAIFGLTKKEIEERVDRIIEFSELEEFIENPVRTYSSGMYMRLAFSVAINVDADILLIDEILAVGDANFQEKCFNKLKEIKEEGTTIIIVSHSMGQIEEICERSIWIENGRIEMEGPPSQVHPIYNDFMNGKRREEINRERQRKKERLKWEMTQREYLKKGRQGELERLEKERIAKEKEAVLEALQKETKIERPGSGEIRFTKASLQDMDGQEAGIFEVGAKAVLHAGYKVYQKMAGAIFKIEILRSDGLLCYETDIKSDQICGESLEIGGVLAFEMERIPYIAGKYSLNLIIETEEGELLDRFKEAVSFEICSKEEEGGTARVEHQWKAVPNTLEQQRDKDKEIEQEILSAIRSAKREVKVFYTLSPDKKGLYLSYSGSGDAKAARLLREKGYEVYSAFGEGDDFYHFTDRKLLEKMRFDGIFMNAFPSEKEAEEDLRFLKTLLKRPDSRIALGLDAKKDEEKMARLGEAAGLRMLKAGEEEPVCLWEMTQKEIEYLPYMSVNDRGEWEEDAIVLGQGGIIYGPYVTMGSGEYYMEAEVEFKDPGKEAEELEAVFRVTASQGVETLMECELEEGMNTAAFTLESKTENLEWVVQNNGEKEIKVKKLRML